MDAVTLELMVALGRLAGVRGDLDEAARTKVDEALSAIEDVVATRLHCDPLR